MKSTRWSRSFLWLGAVVILFMAACSPVKSTPPAVAPTDSTITLLPNVAQGQSQATAPAAPENPSKPTVAAAAQPVEIKGIGILGDSTSDEYRADDERGGEYAETTLSWVEQLVESRDLDFGRWGTWDEPRRTGYEYNWSRSGATAHTMITSGQHTGLAKQVAEGKVSVVILWIGGNDFHLKNGPYEEIYNGTLNKAGVQKKIDAIIADIALATDTILAAGDVKMGIVTVTDQGMGQEAQQIYPDPAKRQRVTDVVNAVNAKIVELAEERGIVVIDSNRLGMELFDRVDANGYVVIAGEKIDTKQPGDEPHHLQLGDWIGHSGTVLSGLVANEVFIKPFNDAFGLGIDPLTDEEILRNAGIK